MVELADFVLGMTSSPGGLLLVDEIENGIHHAALESMWRSVAAVAVETNSQVIATTHSRECVEAAYRSLGESKDLKLFRIVRSDRGESVSPYDAETLGAALEIGLEVR
jgi:AAA15 family ATPase/GTPase